MRVRGTQEVFLLFAMGSQFDHLIAQQMRKLGVFCLVADPASVTVEDVLKVKPTGIILSGGPASVHSEPPPFDCRIFDAGIPVLGICLGFQLWAKHLGIPVVPAEKREFSVHQLTILRSSALFEGIGVADAPVLESHGDRIEMNPVGDDQICNVLAMTANAPAAAAQAGHLWGVQFHPEVTETIHGPQIFENFVFRICGAKDRFPAEDVAARKVRELGSRIGHDKRVLLALSGGSDSSGTAGLLGKAVDYRPGQVQAVYIQGVDRPDDEAFVRKHFGSLPWLDLRFVDATESFLAALRGKETMCDKRVAVRDVYKRVLEQQADLFKADFIAQGTLYTDISESGGGYDGGARKA